MALAGCLIATASGCAAIDRPDAHPDGSFGQGAGAQVDSPAMIAGLSDEDVSGVWEGSSIADCVGIAIANPGRCRAVENIMLTMIQRGTKVTGSYRCSFGTEDCRNHEESGAIRYGSFKRGRVMVRVMLEDGASCYFTGIPRKNRFNGGYSCVGGAVVEQGRFETRRRY
jgi:ribosomal protein L27